VGDSSPPTEREGFNGKSPAATKENEMTAAQFEMLEATEAEELLRARFESLTWHGCPPGNALVIASHLDVELLDAIVLLQRGCPPHLVLPILGD
jgi:hypothetical protein